MLKKVTILYLTHKKGIVMKKKIWCRIIIICVILGFFCGIFLLKNRTHTEMDIISTRVDIDDDDNVIEHIAVVLNSKDYNSNKAEIEEEIIERFQANNFSSTKIVGGSRCVILYADVYTDVHAYETGDKLFHFECRFA